MATWLSLPRLQTLAGTFGSADKVDVVRARFLVDTVNGVVSSFRETVRTRGRNKALENIFENDIVSRILDSYWKGKILHLVYFRVLVYFNLRNHVCMPPNWAIYESSCQQICLQKYPKRLVTLGRFRNRSIDVKNGCGYYLGNFWKHWSTFILQNLVTLHVCQQVHRCRCKTRSNQGALKI